MTPFCVYIGRFQIFHNGHLKVLKNAFNLGKEVILVLGSYLKAPDTDHPFTAEEREEFIRACLTEEENKKLHVVYQRDYLYNDNLWLEEIHQQVDEIAEGKAVTLTGAYKDESSYYLNKFPLWKKELVHVTDKINASALREKYFSGADGWQGSVPAPMAQWLHSYRDCEDFGYFNKELQYLKEHNAIWSTTKFPVNFVTVDSVVLQSAHVLLIRRKTHPGKGLWALPGGYLSQDEEPLQGAIRELKEETQILIPHQELLQSFKEAQLFAHPKRSQRKRIMTVAHLFVLPDGPLPKVKGADDADKARWMPLSDVFRSEETLFEDHGHIIRKFTSKF